MSMASGTGTRLRDLPDDLLQRILYLLPAKEAASTAVLSRRWRSLLSTPWCGVGVHLDTRSGHHHRADSDGGEDADSWDSRCRAFLQGARDALAGHGSVKRLSIRVDAEHRYQVSGLVSYDDQNITDDVLSHPACRGVEQLRIEASTPHDIPKQVRSSMPLTGVGLYELSFGSVPSVALRDLHITNCVNLTSPPQATGFPCLAVLRLQSCGVSVHCLQDMITASPQLHTLHLDYVFITTEETVSHVQSLRCPTVTTLFLDCSYSYQHRVTIELDAPRVRHFRFSGHIDVFQLRTPPPDLARVELHVFIKDGYRLFPPMHEHFWKFLETYCSTKVLKLKLMFPIEDISVADDEELNLNGPNCKALFSNLEHLELDVKHKRAWSKDHVVIAIGNLLQCFPAVTDLNLRLCTVDYNPYKYIKRNSSHSNPWEDCTALLNQKAESDFRKSMDHFKRCKDPVVSFGSGNDADNYSEVSHIPELMRDQWLNINCLHFCLKRVSLQFVGGDKHSNFFGVQLAKIFSETAMVLEEMCIDDGNRKMCEHMNRKFAGRITNPFRPCSDSKVIGGIPHDVGMMKQLCSQPEVKTRGLTILPLEKV